MSNLSLDFKCFKDFTLTFRKFRDEVYSVKIEGELLGTFCFVGYFSNVVNTQQKSTDCNVHDL